MRKLVGSLAAGTLLQLGMVVLGHAVPSLQSYGLFPIAGTLIGLLTGIIAGGAAEGNAQPGSSPAAVPPQAAAGTSPAWMGGVSAGIAGSLGSLVSSALGDVPLSNVLIAGGSTLVMGAIGTALRNRLSLSAGRVPAAPSAH